jgi:NAD(P)-dependent dehydrogenase (short-subunit alcohol dehydrogenase family)
MPFPDYTRASLEELAQLTGRVAVVTGAGRGIGRAIAQRLGEAGACVVLTDRDRASVTAAAEVLSRRGIAASGAQLDVTSSQAVDALVQAVVTNEGGLDIWVNNAGVYPAANVLETTDEQWRHVMAVNLDATFFGARAAGRAMRDGAHGGVILNVASTAAFRAEFSAHYVASKHAVVGLTKALASELGPYGIRVVALAPGLVRTEGMAELATIDATPPARSPAPDQSPAGRMATPDDIARVAYLTATGLAGFVTGSVLAVEGGRLTT